MHFLIDGHNLIGKMPGLSLADSQDELELIIRLKGWVAAASRRQVTIYFDGGGLGGFSQRLSSKDIRVIFAPPDREADDLLIARLNKLRNGRNYTLVSSDNKIINAAKIGGVKVLKSEEFIAREGFDYHKEAEAEKRQPVPEPEPEKDANPVISESEVQEWLDLFGPVPERKPPPPRRRKKAAAPPKEPKRKGILATPADRENPELEDADLDAWLALFGGEKTETPKKKKAGKPKSSSKQKAKPAKPKSKPNNPQILSEEDLKAWNDYFGQS
ncbi:MAG: NYN domain-containing protein [Anaerolineales bacterium]|nr:NYN domain-containing protein [Anaerolineales bacterium]